MPLDLRPRDPRIHVFSVSDGSLDLPHQTYLSKLGDNAPGPSLDVAFGAEIDETYAEVFAVRDVAPMGLRSYLVQAHDVPEDAMADDASKLDGLSGDVIVLAPRAVAGVERLTPRPELTHIGSYSTAEPDMSPRSVPRSADLPPLSAQGTVEKPERNLPRAAIGWIVLAALVLAGLLIWLL